MARALRGIVQLPSRARIPSAATDGSPATAADIRNASQKINGTGGATWTLQFNVDAHARTSYGLAKGSITIE
jgi:hypothetical protein